MVSSEQIFKLIADTVTAPLGSGGPYPRLVGESLAAAFETIAKLVELETTVLMTREHLDAMEKGFIRKPPVHPELN